MASEEFVEADVCSADELQINEKRLVEVGETKVLLIKTAEDQFAALGNVCSHYGAPLINGVYHNGHISCPWHGACFNVKSGDIEEFPGCDSLPTYEATIVDGKVRVRVNKAKAVKKRVKPMVCRSIINRSAYVIIGGGPAGFECAETLRQEGFTGRVVLVSAEDVAPYDRTKLSKTLTAKIDDILLRDEKHFSKHGIELMLNKKSVRVDSKSKIVYFDDGSNLYFNKLFLATGSTPRTISALENVDNVHYLRTHHDARRIANDSADKNVVLIGSSFIVMEIAAYMKDKAKSITIISRSEVPFSKSLGNQIGAQIKEFFTSKSIIFQKHTSPLEYGVQSKKLEKIKFDNIEVDVDVCIVGIGSVPNTDFLKDSDLKMTGNGYIEVNAFFETSAEGVYAGGDVVVYPNTLYANRPMNISHWATAQSHGRYAALRMMKKSTDFTSVPFFWSMLFGKGLRFCGTVFDAENVHIEGDLEKLSFVAYYFDESDQVIGVATMANDPVATAFGAALRNGRVITKDDVVVEGMKWAEEIIV